MLQTIISALLPVLVILFIGYFSGRHHDFNTDQASVLNNMVMLYTLPLSLFCGIITTSLDTILQQRDLLWGLMMGMVGFYFLIFGILRYIVKREINSAAILTMAICSPSVAFVGTTILSEILGNISSLVVSLSSILINLVQMPLTIILLTMGDNKTGNETNVYNSLFKSLKKSVQQPVVWMPVLAFIILLLKIQFPKVLLKSFEMLGSTTSGIALFSSGIILYSYKIIFNRTIGIAVLLKNLIIPIIIGIIIYYLHFDYAIIKETVLALSFPTASTAIILSLQYKTDEQEASSIFFFSTIISIVTMGVFIWILQ